MSKTSRSLVVFLLLGMLGGFLILHPYTMVSYALLHFHENQSLHFKLNEVWFRTLAAFKPTMVPMTISFILFGGLTGFFIGIMIDRKRKLLDAEHENEKNKMALETMKKLKEASLDTIHRLARAAEYKDKDTGAHIIRMSNYSATVARKMGLNDRTVEAILYAAPMHDVGKIGTPDQILLKPGKLDPDEWEIMKQHTSNGGRILEGSSAGFIKLAEVIALTHHEKWDGSGYPDGLKGSKIPLIGRVVAIGDVFDALTSKRPYKEAFPLDIAYGIIRESRGSHFDPDVVDAFFSIEDEILSIKERYKDKDDRLFVRIAG